MKNQEDEFYAELDTKKLRRSCCTFQTMIIFFIIILVGAIIGTIYCFNQIKEINFPSKAITSNFKDKNNFYEKLKPDSTDENFEITVTSEELTAITAEGISGKNFIIKNIQVMIGKDGVDIFGTLTKPLSSQIKITTIPKVENGKIKFEIQKFTAGKLTLPKLINNEVADALNKAMDRNFQELYQNYEVQEISLFDGKMIISGKLK